MNHRAFLSDEWLAAFTPLTEEYRGQITTAFEGMRFNYIVTNVPPDGKSKKLHASYVNGIAVADGHSVEYDAVIAIDYEVFRAMFLGARNDTFIKALTEGKVRVLDGYFGRFLAAAMRTPADTPARREFLDKVRAMTD